MTLQSLRGDLVTHRARIARLAVRGQNPDQLAAVLRVELAENLYPLLEALFDFLDADVLAPLADVGAAVDELIEQSAEVLHPATAAAILAVLAQGEALAGLLEAATAGNATAETNAAIAQYRALAQEVATHVATIALEPQQDQEVGDDGASEQQADDDESEVSDGR